MEGKIKSNKQTTTTSNINKQSTTSNVEKQETASVSYENYAELLKQVNTLKQEKEEQVTILCMCDTNYVLNLGKYGYFNGMGTIRSFNKKDFLNFRGDGLISWLLQSRFLIVISGLTESERKLYNLDYDKDEYLTYDVYMKLLDLQDDELYKVFEKLCPMHREIVSRLFASQYAKNDNRVFNINKLKKLNEISMENDEDGLFTPLINDLLEKSKQEISQKRK